MKEVVRTNQVGTQALYAARSQGLTAVTNYFVQPDLSKVKPKDIQKKLVDVTNRFKSFTVGSEAKIGEFVSRRTRRPYKIGQAYFELMKPEKVQADKQVLLQETNQPTIWGGPEARRLINLPDGADAKVTPGNHANYKIFVQSKTTNRQLPRGTKVLVDLTHTKDSKPTWEDPNLLQASPVGLTRSST